MFTKKLDWDLVSSVLGNHFTFDFLDIIAINIIETESFELKNHSLIFTSANAVVGFFKNNFKLSDSSKIYAVGTKTENELQKHGFKTAKVCANAAELSKFILENGKNEQFLHFCGNLSLEVLNTGLSQHNISYKKIAVYETRLLYPELSENYDAACFFSPSGVRSFAKFNSLGNMQLFAIGETTANELNKFTKNKIITSKKNTLEDLLKLVKVCYEQ